MDRTVLRVLVYLSARVLINSFQRAFSNPLRAMLILFVLALVLCGWGGSILGIIVGSSVRTPPPTALSRPPEQVLDSSIVSMFLIHWLYVVFTLVPAVWRSPHILVVESDVHYLFTTPLKPLALFRGIILIRGLLGAIAFLLLLIFYLFTIGGASLRSLMQAQLPTESPWLILLYPLMYLLMFATAVLGSIAIETLEVAGRSVRKWWVRGLIGWVVLSLLLVVGRFIYLQRGMPRTIVPAHEVLDWLPVYLVLLPVRALADAALVLYTGFTPAIGVGLLFWLGGVLLGNAVLVRHQRWLYEVGAFLARGASLARSAQQDPLGTYLRRKAEAAAHKLFKTPALLQRWTPRGVWALLWRDLLISWRASSIGNLITIAFIAGAPAAFVLWISPLRADANVVVAMRFAYASTQAVLASFLAFSAYYGIADMLRRVDWQKPLPFDSRAVVIVESLPLVVLFAIAQVITVGLTTLIVPREWLFWLLSSLVALSWASALQMAMFWIALVNPDPHDYTQRLITGVMSVPLLTITGGPGLAFWMLWIGAGWHPLVGAGLTLAANLFASMVMTAINSALYERFSPVD